MPGIAIYARKSTESEDRQILSIDSQVRELKMHAVREGFQVEKVFTESMSAKAPGRPVFNELYMLIQKGKLDGIVCWKLDRLARNPVDGGAIIWAVEENKLKHLVTPQRSFNNTGKRTFDEGNNDVKRACLHYLGSNLTLRNGILNIYPQKPFVMIRKAVDCPSANGLMLEPATFSYAQQENARPKSVISSWVAHSGLGTGL